MRPCLLDLFCGAGGAAMGYSRAGFAVVGVDIRPQPHYPFGFHEQGALGFLENWLNQPDWPLTFDAIHASPPCQPYMTGGVVDRRRQRDLLCATRDLLRQSGVPWVIENVPGAPMRPDVVLCGSQFGLEVRRHRLFEFSDPLTLPLLPPCDHSRPVTGVYGHPHGSRGAWPGMLPSDLKTWQRAMDIDWMDAPELVEAIPPAYTEFIGRQLIGQWDTQEALVP